MSEDVSLTVQVNLRALRDITAQKLQRLLDVIDFSRAGAPLVDDTTYPVRAFFQFHPSGNTRLSLSDARHASQEWHVLHALREALELVSTFLEEARRCCAVYQLAQLEQPRVSDLNDVDRTSRQFHRLGLPLKIQRIQDAYGVVSEFAEHIVRLNDARNCIVHRNGVVTIADVAADGTLVVSWSRLVLMARSPDGSEERIIDGPVTIDGGWTITAAARVIAKTFVQGDRIVFEFEELVGMIWSCLMFVNTIAVSVQAYAEGLGFVFAAPTQQPDATDPTEGA